MTVSIKDKYYIKKITYSQATDTIVKKHYLHRQAPCSFAFGLFEQDSKFLPKLMGVVIYGTPVSSTLRTGICGNDEKDNVIELTRLWIDDSVEKNGESFLIGNTLKLVDKEIIVSFAEIEQGHTGVIYQATNFYYTGLSAKRTDWTVEGVNKHSHTIADKYTSKELKRKYGNKFALKPRPRKHRYVFFNAKGKRKEKLLNKLKYPIVDYPKEIPLNVS